MIGLWAVLCAAQKAVVIEIPNTGKFLGSFGFDSNSYIEADASGLFAPNSTDFVSLQLLTAGEYSTYLSKKNHRETSCYGQYLFSDLELRLSSDLDKGRLNVNVSRVYYVVAFGCNDTFYASNGIQLILKNSSGYLDTREYWGIRSMLIVAGLALVVAVGWAILVVWQRSKVKKMHLIICVMAFGPVLDQFLMHFYLDESNRLNQSNVLGALWFMLRLANYTVIAMAMLFATLGLSVFCDELSTEVKVREFAISLLLVLSVEWLVYWNYGEGQFLALIVSFLGIGFYTREIVVNITNGSAVVIAALVGTEGCASETSFLYKEVQYLLIGIGLMVIFNLGVSALGNFIDQWVRWTIEGLSQISVILGFCIIYRINLPFARGSSYQSINESGTGRRGRVEDSEMLLADLDSHDVEDTPNEPGMRSQPLLGNSDRLPRLATSSGA